MESLSFCAFSNIPFVYVRIQMWSTKDVIYSPLKYFFLFLGLQIVWVSSQLLLVHGKVYIFPVEN